MKNRRNFWDRAAIIYDRFMRRDAAAYDRMYALLRPVVRDKTVLELAAGNPLSDQELCTILGQVGLCAQDYTDRQVDASLSGGESKRIEIATVLARKDANLLIFDEPEAGIDLWSFSGLIDVFQRIKSRKQDSALIISHQERILQIADEIIVIADGEVRSAGPREQILPTLLGDEKTGRCPLEGGPLYE